MSPNDWIMVGFVALALLMSFACRWQRTREQREWAQFHAPLSGDASELRIDIALQPTQEWTRQVDANGRFFWQRNNEHVSGLPGYVVHFEHPPLPPPGSAEPETHRLEEDSAVKLVLEDASTSVSKAWHETTSTSEQPAKQLVDARHQSFPARMAAFAVQVSEDATAAPTVIQLQRASVLTESLDALARLSPPQGRAAIRIAFVGEPGIDAGGVYREWVSLVAEQLPRSEAGVFTCVDTQNQLFYLNSHSAEARGERHLLHIRAAGRFVGRALRDGHCLGFHFAPPLLKLLLGEPVGFPDLADFDPELHRHLLWLAEKDQVEALSLDFTVCERLPSGVTRSVELVARGHEIAVTDTTKRDYVNAVALHRLVHSVSAQLDAFLSGVHDVVAPEALTLFADARELDYVLSGEDDEHAAIDVDDWHTRYTQDLWHHPTRRWFWEIVHEMPPRYQRRLLQFATGLTRPPLAGFRALTSYDGRLAPFTLVGRPLVDEGFVRSHACFNRLDVPLYVNRNHLRRGLYALLETDVLGFSMA